MNEFIKTVISRRSVRKFDGRAPEEQALLDIIEAGRYAPSGGNNQYTHLMVIRNPEALVRLRELVCRELAKIEVDDSTYKSLKNAVLASRKGGYVYDYGAPVILAAANRRDYGNAMADSVCVIENILLAARSLNIGSCYINPLHWLAENPALRAFFQEFGLGREESVCAAAALGYSALPLEEMSPLPRTGNPVTYVD